jgi:quinol monooxygenase YgiN
MVHVIHLVLSGVMISSGLGAQARADAPPDTAAYAVSYVEVMASARPRAVTALKQYREANRKEDGYLRIEFFEQTGRPGHFALVETWRDQKAFDAHSGAARTQLLEALQSIRVSDYDQRPYKTLAVGTTAAAGNQAVTVVTHVDVAPNPQVAVLLKRLAEASRQDDGNLRFDVVQHMMRANHFTVVETWRNQQALDAHVAAAHTKQYRDELAPMTGSPLDERVYKAVE